MSKIQPVNEFIKCQKQELSLRYWGIYEEQYDLQGVRATITANLLNLSKITFKI